MNVKLSLKSKQELLEITKIKYQNATWEEKSKILDAFLINTNYRRKYAIYLLNKPSIINKCQTKKKRLAWYDNCVKEALIIIWHAANKICSKRLVPFLSDFINKLENHGHINLSIETRNKLLSISPATVDRILALEHKQNKKNNSTTRCGGILKKQIKIKTFADWNEIIPGFIEADLVAHCGDTVSGSFLNTLVLTDIVSGWTEFMPLLFKSEDNVIAGLKIAKEMIPFNILGLDTDNGSEFINYGLLKFCEDEKITFTRSRAYRSNDQAHVEEKNGSIVRRLVGYDRYEGTDALRKLTELYSVMRLYVNFFQPSMKLCSKERKGAKIIKKYKQAQTPYQRLLNSSYKSEEKIIKLVEQYKHLDPIKLLRELQEKQEAFWKYAWVKSNILSQQSSTNNAAINLSTNKEDVKNINNKVITNINTNKPLVSLEYYKHSKKNKKQLGPRTWRTRKDPFETVSQNLLMQLAINPVINAKDLLSNLIKEFPENFNMSHLRTLQRKIANWRNNNLQKERDYQLKIMNNQQV
jgi:hypothetical protein